MSVFGIQCFGVAIGGRYGGRRGLGDSAAGGGRRTRPAGGVGDFPQPDLGQELGARPVAPAQVGADFAGASGGLELRRRKWRRTSHRRRAGLSCAGTSRGGSCDGVTGQLELRRRKSGRPYRSGSGPTGPSPERRAELATARGRTPAPSLPTPLQTGGPVVTCADARSAAPTRPGAGASGAGPSRPGAREGQTCAGASGARPLDRAPGLARLAPAQVAPDPLNQAPGWPDLHRRKWRRTRSTRRRAGRTCAGASGAGPSQPDAEPAGLAPAQVARAPFHRRGGGLTSAGATAPHPSRPAAAKPPTSVTTTTPPQNPNHHTHETPPTIPKPSPHHPPHHTRPRTAQPRPSPPPPKPQPSRTAFPPQRRVTPPPGPHPRISKLKITTKCHKTRYAARRAHRSNPPNPRQIQRLRPLRKQCILGRPFARLRRFHFFRRKCS